MPVIQFIGRCGGCGQMVDLRIDTDKKTTTDAKDGNYIVPCCNKCKEHLPLYLLIPYDIRSSKYVDEVKWE